MFFGWIWIVVFLVNASDPMGLAAPRDPGFDDAVCLGDYYPYISQFEEFDAYVLDYIKRTNDELNAAMRGLSLDLTRGVAGNLNYVTNFRGNSFETDQAWINEWFDRYGKDCPMLEVREDRCVLQDRFKM